MPILKANEALPERAVIISIYGEPGVAKTTIANTAENPLLLDFDRGVARSFLRKDTVIINSWDDVLKEEEAGTFKNYKTVIIDTSKAALDDFLMAWVCYREPKLKTNKLQAYGQIGEEFKAFVSRRRLEGIDVILIAHAKKDEDTKKMIPDITGQSYNLTVRLSDQIGYVSMVNNRRSIQWNPTDVTIGKNTANLPFTEIPSKESPALRTFMSVIIADVKKAIVQKSEAQMEDLNKIESFTKAISEAKNADDINLILTAVLELPKYLKDQILISMKVRTEELKLIWHAEQKLFEDPKSEDKKEDPKAEGKKPKTGKQASLPVS